MGGCICASQFGYEDNFVSQLFPFTFMSVAKIPYPNIKNIKKSTPSSYSPNNNLRHDSY